jgi:hypothetical protein
MVEAPKKEGPEVIRSVLGWTIGEHAKVPGAVTVTFTVATNAQLDRREGEETWTLLLSQAAAERLAREVLAQSHAAPTPSGGTHGSPTRQ